jgi:hypothetical protein
MKYVKRIFDKKILKNIHILTNITFNKRSLKNQIDFDLKFLFFPSIIKSNLIQ